MRYLAIAFGLWILLMSCEKGVDRDFQRVEGGEDSIRIGIILANHGSRSLTWRRALMDLTDSVEENLFQLPHVVSVKTAYMEYAEPSIATTAKQLDSIGVTHIIVIPVFLTISPHTFEDIPTILGVKEDPKSLEMLRAEGIARYVPKAKVRVSKATLNYTNLLKENLLRRAKALSQNPKEEGVVLIGYGDASYEKEWAMLFDSLGRYLEERLGFVSHSYGWCGHLVHYDPKETTKAIEKVLMKAKRAIVLPVLVAHDEMFQVRIIGDGINAISDAEKRVRYKPDAILPDPYLEQWIYQVAKDEVNRLIENREK